VAYLFKKISPNALIKANVHRRQEPAEMPKLKKGLEIVA
jgi:hypothetical protein